MREPRGGSTSGGKDLLSSFDNILKLLLILAARSLSDSFYSIH